MAVHEHETHVVETGGGSSGIIAGVIIAVLVVLALLFFFNWAPQGGSGTADIDVPAVSVDVAPDGQ